MKTMEIILLVLKIILPVMEIVKSIFKRPDKNKNTKIGNKKTTIYHKSKLLGEIFFKQE